jgi:hypothetical protein
LECHVTIGLQPVTIAIGWLPTLSLREIQEWRTQRVQRFYFGEYLSQGSLDIQGHSVQTSLENLIHNGLFKLVPAMGDHERWHLWAKRAVELRAPFENSDSPSVTARSEVRKAIVVAEKCFGSHWTLPTALMLLSVAIRPRYGCYSQARIPQLYRDS